MVRFHLELPWGSYHVAYGFDPTPGIGWFGELVHESGQVIATYDALGDDYQPQRPLRGLLVWLGHKSELWDEPYLDYVLLQLTEDPQDLIPGEVIAGVLRNLWCAAEYG